ncbi:hypothetical protein V8F20_009683 [Naviculisporaceae sp. PSN 640]
MPSKRSKSTKHSVAGRSTGVSLANFRMRAPAPPPPPTYYVKLFLVLPLPGHGFNDFQQLNFDVEEALNQIRRHFRVDLTVHDDRDMVEIRAINRKMANEALKAIRKLLERKPGDRVVWRPLALIKPLQGGNNTAQIALVPLEGLDGARAVAIANPDNSSNPADPAESLVYREEFEQALARAVANLRFVPNRMRMRINFGQILLKEWKKERSEYTFNELQQMAERAGPRGTVYIHTHMGRNTTVSRIREQLPQVFEDCVAQDIRVHNAEDAQPSMSLVLITKNLVCESVVDAAQGTTEIGSKGAPKYKYILGPMSVFHREKRARAVTIMTSCPQDRFDWCLEVENQIDDKKTALPFTAMALKQNVLFKETVTAQDFPPIRTNPQFLKAHQVELVIGKTSWSYLINSQYVLEVGLYHQWHLNTTGKPQTGAVVSLYGCDWDTQLGPANVAAGPRDWDNFSDQFLQPDSEDDDSDRLAGLFTLISKIQGILAKAMEEVS